MIVLELSCPEGHRFEGWFPSHGGFASQIEAQTVRCPTCDSSEITRLPTPCNIGTQGRAERVSEEPRDPGRRPDMVLRALRTAVLRAENVGERFAEESRRIHYGEAEARSIRGKTTPREAQELAEEGIDVIPLPFKLPEEMN